MNFTELSETMDGRFLDRQVSYYYLKGGRTYPVPYHKGKEIGTGLKRKMKREMGLKY